MIGRGAAAAPRRPPRAVAAENIENGDAEFVDASPKLLDARGFLRRIEHRFVFGDRAAGDRERFIQLQPVVDD